MNFFGERDSIDLTAFGVKEDYSDYKVRSS